MAEKYSLYARPTKFPFIEKERQGCQSPKKKEVIYSEQKIKSE